MEYVILIGATVFAAVYASGAVII